MATLKPGIFYINCKLASIFQSSFMGIPNMKAAPTAEPAAAFARDPIADATPSMAKSNQSY